MSLTIRTPIGNVTAVALLDGHTKGISGQGGGPFVRQKYLVDWDKVDAFSNAVMGITSLYGGVAAGTIYRALPLACPESPNLFAVEIGEIEGTGKFTPTDGPPEWEFGIVPVSFGPLKFGTGAENPENPDPNTPDEQSYPFVSFEIDSETEILNVPHTAYKYVYNGKPVGYPIGVRISVTNIAATLHSVPYLPMSLLNLKGSVNQQTFMGCSFQTLLFDKWRTKLVNNTDGTRTQDLEMHFKHRSQRWNNAPKPDDGSTFTAISHNGQPIGSGGNPVYPLADLRPCFLGLSLN